MLDMWAGLGHGPHDESPKRSKGPYRFVNDFLSNQRLKYLCSSSQNVFECESKSAHIFERHDADSDRKSVV